MSREELEQARDNFVKAMHSLKILGLCASFTCKIANVEKGFDDYNLIFAIALRLHRLLKEAGHRSFDEMDLEHEFEMIKWHKENFPELYDNK